MTLARVLGLQKPPKKHHIGAIPYYAAQAGLGSPMQRGEGSAYREGSLGAGLSLTNDNLIFLAIGGIAGLIAVKKGYLKKGFLGT
jgi:hypothetical protein